MGNGEEITTSDYLVGFANGMTYGTGGFILANFAGKYLVARVILAREGPWGIYSGISDGLDEFKDGNIMLSMVLIGSSLGGGKKPGKGSKNKGIGKREQVLDKVKTYEKARNKALDLVGDLGPNSHPYTGTLKSSAGYGQVVGRQSADGKVR